MARIPFGLKGEYRGVKPAGEWTTPDGKLQEFDSQLRFEVELPDGDIEVIGLRRGELDKVANFDVEKLKKGDVLDLSGVVSFGVGKSGASFCILDLMGARMAGVPAKLSSAA